MAMTTSDTFAVKFRLDHLVLRTYEHWCLSLRPQQVTLGSMVISTSDGATSFGELEGPAAVELIKVMADAERVGSQLGAERINFLALMMRDPIVHFHVFPRYSQTAVFEGRQWNDGDWPRPPSLDTQRVTDTELEALLKGMKTLLHT